MTLILTLKRQIHVSIRILTTYSSQETFNHQTQSNFKDTTESSIKTQNHFSINPMITVSFSLSGLILTYEIFKYI